MRKVLAVAVASAVVSCAPVDDAVAAEAACTVSDEAVDCRPRVIALDAGWVGPRNVFWKTPTAAAPSAGRAAVVLFQGSYFSAQSMWHGATGAAIGGRYQTETIAALLDAGFVVITPETKGGGLTFWDTNVPPFSTNWESSLDHQLMLSLFAAIADGTFGPIDGSKLFAAGISSGGYMTSRMAVSYPGAFRALAIHSGSYATCAGFVCTLPETLPADHPPTLFVHGDADAVVPIGTMTPYQEKLAAAGTETQTLIGEGEGHGWLPGAPDAIRAFFVAHAQ